MKAIVFDKIGSPTEVLRLAEVPLPKIKEGEALIKMTSASVNPGDFLFIQNLYPAPKKPVFPQQIVGNHGAGIVEKTKSNISIKQGTHVAFSYYNTWSEYAAVPEEWLIPLPADYPIEKASQFLNLITAWDVLAQSAVLPGQWIALTAGNSSVSTIISQFAKYRGINVIAIVRNSHPSIDLTAMGATAVIDLSLTRGNIRDQVMEITQSKGVNGIVDNVGGPLTTELIKSTAFGSTLVINGGMSAEKYTLHNNDVYLNGLTIKSHIYRYFFSPPKKEDASILNEIIMISSRDDFNVPIAKIHSLDEYAAAVAESFHGKNKGKHIFKIS